MNINTRNLLLNIKNNSIIKKGGFYSKFSKQNLILLELLYNQGFIQSFRVLKSSSQIYIFLRYLDNKSVFNHFKILSNSLNLKNLNYLELSKLFNKRFVLFLFTNKGLITSYECKKYKIGGKSLFFC